MFALVLKSDRAACIDRIKKDNYRVYSEFMAENKLQSVKRK